MAEKHGLWPWVVAVVGDADMYCVSCARVNSSEKIPKSATPKVSRGGEFYFGTFEEYTTVTNKGCGLGRWA